MTTDDQSGSRLVSMDGVTVTVTHDRRRAVLFLLVSLLIGGFCVVYFVSNASAVDVELEVSHLAIGAGFGLSGAAVMWPRLSAKGRRTVVGALVALGLLLGLFGMAGLMLLGGLLFGAGTFVFARAASAARPAVIADPTGVRLWPSVVAARRDLPWSAVDAFDLVPLGQGNAVIAVHGRLPHGVKPIPAVDQYAGDVFATVSVIAAEADVHAAVTQLERLRRQVQDR